MNKSDFIAAIQAKTDMSKADVAKLVTAYNEVVMETLAKGDDVRLLGFGTFATSERKAREGRNPHTGETMQIAAGRAVRFSASSNFKEAVNK